jgi:hypothetical protein
MWFDFKGQISERLRYDRKCREGWSITAIVLFLIMAGLTFVQRAVTGM